MPVRFYSRSYHPSSTHSSSAQTYFSKVSKRKSPIKTQLVAFFFFFGVKGETEDMAASQLLPGADAIRKGVGGAKSDTISDSITGGTKHPEPQFETASPKKAASPNRSRGRPKSAAGKTAIDVADDPSVFVFGHEAGVAPGVKLPLASSAACLPEDWNRLEVR